MIKQFRLISVIVVMIACIPISTHGDQTSIAHDFRSGQQIYLSLEYKFRDAGTAYKAGNYDEAFRLVIEVASQPNVSVVFPGATPDPGGSGTYNSIAGDYVGTIGGARKWLADHYAKGLGTTPNPTEAARWCQKANEVQAGEVFCTAIANAPQPSPPSPSSQTYSGPGISTYACYRVTDNVRTTLIIDRSDGKKIVHTTLSPGVFFCNGTFTDGVTGHIADRNCNLPGAADIVMRQSVRITTEVIEFGGVILQVPAILNSMRGQDSISRLDLKTGILTESLAGGDTYRCVLKR